MDVLLSDEEFLPAAHQLVATARKTIYITTFKAELTLKPRGRRLYEFFKTLHDKARIGVDVRLILSKVDNQLHTPDSNRYVMRELPQGGIPVRYLPNNRICHAKIIIVDDFAAILGSHNLSCKACHNNFEMSYQLHSPAMVERLNMTFLRLWETGVTV